MSRGNIVDYNSLNQRGIEPYNPATRTRIEKNCEAVVKEGKNNDAKEEDTKFRGQHSKETYEHGNYLRVFHCFALYHQNNFSLIA